MHSQSTGTSKYDLMTVAYTNWVIRRRWWILLGSVLLTLAAATGMQHLGLVSDYRAYFSEDNPDLRAFEALEKIYSKNDNILFVVKPRQGDVFTGRTLEAVRSLTEASWQIPHSTRVDAITNFQHTWSENDDLVVEDLLPAGEITSAMVERVREVSMNEPLLLGRLIATDGEAAGINIRILLPGESQDELPATVAFAYELEARYRAAYPELEIHTTGISMLNSTFTEAPMKDMPMVMPFVLVAFVLAIAFFLRSALATLATLAVIMFSTVTAIGVTGFFGVMFDPTSASAPTVILTLAVADAMHILISFFDAFRSGKSRHEALIETMKLNTQPVFLTSITTAFAFLSLNFSDSPPYQLLGNVAAFGVMVAWFFSMTLLPALVALLPIKVTRPSVLGDRLTGYLGRVITRQYRKILPVMTLVSITLIGIVPTLQINDQYFEYFDESLSFRQATDFALEHLTGLYNVSFSLESGASQGVTEPVFLGKVKAFTEWLRTRPAVVHVNSFSDTMERLNMNMHGDDPDYLRLPENQEMGAQYLLLYELSLPYGLDVNDQINIDKSALRIDITFGNVDIATIEEEVALAKVWLQKNGTPSMQDSQAAGATLMFANITRRNINSMVVGTVFGFIGIALILMVSLKNVRMGILSLIPNVLPAGMAFGIWALFIGEAGFAISVVTGLAIGIIVDDTVHFLSKYNRARRELSAEDSVQYVFKHVGSAILGTTFIVVIGFAMLGLSTFRVTAYMGLLTSLTVGCALISDFLLLPALLLALDRKKKRAPEPSSVLLIQS